VPTGVSQEVGSCNVDTPCSPSVDCAFTEWETWSGCTFACDGVKRRGRGIKVFRKGDGKACEGATKETWPCNPGAGEERPWKCGGNDAIDCQLSKWAWGQCSVACGGGQMSRQREILVHQRGTGKACNNVLEETGPCGETPCETGCKPKDCKWSEWGVWSACTKCGGERTRQRNIIDYVECGGQHCEAADAEQVAKCVRSCHEQAFCTWADWLPWSTCSADCGKGRRHRQRSLMVTTSADKQLWGNRQHASWDERARTPAMSQAFEEVDEAQLERNLKELHERARAMEARRLKELVVAFGSGLVVLMVFVVGFRALSRSGSSRGVSAALSGDRQLGESFAPLAGIDTRDHDEWNVE